MGKRFCLDCKAREFGFPNPKLMFEHLLWKQGYGHEEISKMLGVGRRSISAMVKRSGAEPRSRGRRKIRNRKGGDVK